VVILRAQDSSPDFFVRHSLLHYRCAKFFFPPRESRKLPARASLKPLFPPFHCGHRYGSHKEAVSDFFFFAGIGRGVLLFFPPISESRLSLHLPPPFFAGFITFFVWPLGMAVVCGSRFSSLPLSLSPPRSPPSFRGRILLLSAPHLSPLFFARLIAFFAFRRPL